MPEARLKVTDSQGRRFVSLTKPIFTIGRRTAADLQIVSTDVSREHAEIVSDGTQYVLRDRGSRYGTFVNGEAVSERALLSGDRIRLGRTEAVELIFQGSEDQASGLRDGLRDTATDAVDFRQVAALMDGLRALGSGRVLPEVLTLVMDRAIDVTKADRGFVMLPNAAGDLEVVVAQGRDGSTLTGTPFTTSAKIPREVFTSGQSKAVDDLLEDGNLAKVHDGTIAIGIRRVLCVPLRVVPPSDGTGEGPPPHVIGVLYLDGRNRASMQSKAVLDSLEAFATQAAIAIESARLYAEAAEKGRIERELRVAADIQRALLAEPVYDGRFCDLVATSIPCRTIGGDFFDYLELRSGSFAFGLGDVAGKGAPAALQAAAVQTNFAALAPVGSTPADTMERINQALLRRAVDARFATMFYGVLDPDGQLQYSNAGQEPPFVIRAGGEVSLLEVGGPVLGLLSGISYDFATTPLQPGDVVVVCSDGVTEARSATNEEFGRERAIEAIRSLHGARPDVVMDALMAALRTFVGVAAQADDITVLVVRYAGVPPGPAQGAQSEPPQIH
jgi:sigma-B regulation protein RsbU (phosphoserine phosphatase)